MSPARERSSLTVVIGGLVVMCVVLWLLRGATEPDPPPASTVHAGVAARGTPAAAIPTSQPAVPELPPPPEAPELRGHDTVDPCGAGFEPAIPPGYDTLVIDGVTVAWQPGATVRQGPYDVALQPTAIAYLVNGLVAEAAALTGTQRRDRLTVILYASREVFFAATHAPPWSDGIYDGGAVRIAALPAAELGVEIAGLRHELMHAQLHAALGCMPSWFNEGLAMYFAGASPIRQWMRMLRAPDGFDLHALQVPTFAMLPTEQAERAYAESLAMILVVLEHGGEAGLRTAVQTLRATAQEAPRAELELWDRLYPGAGHHVVLDALARRLFAVPVGSELDGLLHGAVCCHGLRAVTDLGCRSVPPRADRKRWIDQTGSPRATCDATW